MTYVSTSWTSTSTIAPIAPTIAATVNATEGKVRPSPPAQKTAARAAAMGSAIPNRASITGHARRTATILTTAATEPATKTKTSGTARRTADSRAMKPCVSTTGTAGRRVVPSTIGALPGSALPMRRGSVEQNADHEGTGARSVSDLPPTLVHLAAPNRHAVEGRRIGGSRNGLGYFAEACGGTRWEPSTRLWCDRLLFSTRTVIPQA